jgi:hypothetical protein
MNQLAEAVIQSEGAGGKPWKILVIAGMYALIILFHCYLFILSLY